MLKNTYLNNSDVNAFINWLSNELNQKSLTHSYTLPNKTTLTFQGLDDAFNKYNWPFNFSDPTGAVHTGQTFTASTSSLATIAWGLNANSTNDSAICDWACVVMMWGGVTNGNVAWLRSNVVGLAKEIDTVRKILAGNDDDFTYLKPIRRFNAGMTKVYSLLVPDFIIYDSRVAASLAWLVATWCISAGKVSVPDELAFPCMPPKEGDNPKIRKSRNPSCNSLQFPDMNGNVRRHAKWNMRASWILKECLVRSSNTVFHQQKANDLRALEAALFMWGYDLNRSLPCGSDLQEIDGPIDIESSVAKDYEKSDIDVLDCKEEWVNLITLGGRSKRFCWMFDIEKDSILIDRGQKEPDEFSTHEIFSILHRLYDKFGDDWFPLANNVTKLRKGTEVDGLGSFICNASINGVNAKVPSQLVTHAQAASQLGPILMYYNLFEWNQKAICIAWRLQVTPPPTIDNLRMLLSAA